MLSTNLKGSALASTLFSSVAITPIALAETDVETSPKTVSQSADDYTLKSAAESVNVPTRILVGESYWQYAVNSAKSVHLEEDVLRRSKIKISFDGLDAQPLLNVGLMGGGTSAARNSTIRFDVYSNYKYWIDRAQIEVYAAEDSLSNKPIATLPVDFLSSSVEWTVPDGPNNRAYTYALRVFDASGNFDLTARKHLTIVTKVEPLKLAPRAIGPIYGEDATAQRNIEVRGGLVTVSGRKFDHEMRQSLTVMGVPVRSDDDGDFAFQEILPAGKHDIEVQYTEADGNLIKTIKTVNIPENEVFFVALGDLTVGTQSSDRSVLLEASGEDFESSYFIGRGAFYLKGKVKGRYLLTASMDTTEDDIESLLSNLADKDPDSVLRRIDPDRYYPVYGDNSTYTEDAPTQGRFYVRLEDGDDHIVWGNFFTNITQTEFGQIDRGLYGAKGEYNSDVTIESGERVFRATLFSADPGTLPARQEFRGTGGSVYFLENQDVAIGSERLRVELRDPNSGLVLETSDLRPYVDYEIDYIQGRIMLSAPLASTQLSDEIVRDGTLSGANVYLVARYEYTQTFGDIDGYTTGGRFERWANEKIRFGLTAQNEETGDSDQTLIASDILVRHSESTYLKAEVSETKGAAFDERASLDGGFTFSTLSADAASSTRSQAWRFEGAVLAADMGKPSLPVKLTGFYESLDDGFSAPGRLTRGDTARYGVGLEAQLDPGIFATFKYDSISIANTVEEDTASSNLRYTLNDSWQLGGGLRYNDLSGPLIVETGERIDAALELRNTSSESFTYYGFLQSTLRADQDRNGADRAGLGLEAQLLETVRVQGELSEGDGGLGALAGLSWQRADGEEYYLNYTLDADRTEPGVDGIAFQPNAENNLTVGTRQRFHETVSVYGEERVSFGDQAGLTHAYGLDFLWKKRWSFGASFEIGEVEEIIQRLEREAYTVTAGYADNSIRAGGAFEWRIDEEDTAKRETWLLRTNASMTVSPDWTALFKYNKSESSLSGGDFFDGNFTDAQIGAAYRPTTNDRINALLRYTFYEELPAVSQMSNSGQTERPAQRSNIFSADWNYRLNTWLTLGGKIGYRDSEVSLSHNEEDFVSNNASLFVARADIHFVKKWDAIIEARSLEVDEANDHRNGFLAALYRHVGDNGKIGIGYNLTDFSDDLTDLSYNDDGLFLNILAKF